MLDLTERKRLQRELWAAQRMEAIGRLAGGVAHDFNNLLTVIGGYAGFLIDRAAAKDIRRATTLEVIQDATERAALLTRQLLAFSRRQVLQPRAARPERRWCAELERMLRRLIGEDIELVHAPRSRASALVQADPGQIEQVLMNLVVNARDAMPQGGTLTVETANVELDEPYVADRSADVRARPVRDARGQRHRHRHGRRRRSARIFEPFFTHQGARQGHRPRPVDGLRHRQAERRPHLGLQRARAAARRSRSTCRASRRRAAPRWPTATPLRRAAARQRDRAAGGGRRARCAMARAVSCERNGYRVLEARDGEEALLLCERRPRRRRSTCWSPTWSCRA